MRFCVFGFFLCCCFLHMRAQVLNAPLPKDLLRPESKIAVTFSLGPWWAPEEHPEHFSYLQMYLYGKLGEMGISGPKFFDYFRRYHEMTPEATAGITHHIVISIMGVPKDPANIEGYSKVSIYGGALKGTALMATLTPMPPSMPAVMLKDENLAMAIAKLHEAITGHREYFNMSGEPIDFWVNKEQHQGFPADLPKQGILFLKLNDKDLQWDQKINQSIEKTLTNDYPFKSKVVDRYAVEQEKSSGYKYILFYRESAQGITVIYPSENNMPPTEETKNFTGFIFSLRDMTTGEEYTCMDKPLLNIFTSIKEFAEQARSHFGTE